jgi:hypothetical protein
MKVAYISGQLDIPFAISDNGSTWQVKTEQGFKFFRTAKAALLFSKWNYIERYGEDPFQYFAEESSSDFEVTIMEWITNISHPERKDFQSSKYIISRPRPTHSYTSEELEKQGMLGIYKKVNK